VALGLERRRASVGVETGSVSRGASALMDENFDRNAFSACIMLIARTRRRVHGQAGSGVVAVNTPGYAMKQLEDRDALVVHEVFHGPSRLLSRRR